MSEKIVRETSTIRTPISGQELVLYTFVTGHEKRALTNMFLGEGSDVEKFNKAQDLALSTIIVSVDGTTEDIVKRVLDMRYEDSKFVTDAVNDVTSGKKGDEKKT